MSTKKYYLLYLMNPGSVAGLAFVILALGPAGLPGSLPLFLSFAGGHFLTIFSRLLLGSFRLDQFFPAAFPGDIVVFFNTTGDTGLFHGPALVRILAVHFPHQPEGRSLNIYLAALAGSISLGEH